MGLVGFLPSLIASILLASVYAVTAWGLHALSKAEVFAALLRTQNVLKQLALPFAPPLASDIRTVPQRSAANGSVTNKNCKNASQLRPIGHVKILREFDASISPACAGRMVISGRMADVCAELERMVQLERLHTK
jgi:hypothetical protein